MIGISGARLLLNKKVILKFLFWGYLLYFYSRLCYTVNTKKKEGLSHENKYENHNDDVCITTAKAPAFLHVCLLAVFFHIHVV